jgi:hypothetical protein
MHRLKYLVFACLPALLFLSILFVTGQTLAQTDEKTFTNTKFGLSLKYPSDWTFVPGEQEFTPGIYDYTVMIPPGSASLGEFCPNSNVGSNSKVADCGTESPAGLSISVYNLKDGTTLEEFYEKELTKFNTEVKSLVGGREIIETNKVNISGLPAIQTISVTTGGGSLGNALKMIGKEPPGRKDIFVYLVNGNTGYQIFGGTDDKKDFDTYYPTLQKMIDSFQIQRAKENLDNAAFIPDTQTAPNDDLVLLSHRMKKGSGDYNDIIGQVKNIGSDTVEFVKIGLTIYDKNSDVIGTDSTYADSTTLKPNQKSSFDIFSSKDNFIGMKNYELTLQWRDSNGDDQYVDNAQIYKINATKQ